MRADSYLLTNETDKAINDYNAVLGNDEPIAYSRLGYIYLDKKKLDDAEYCFNHGGNNWYNSLGNAIIYFLKEQYNKSNDYYLRTLKSYPSLKNGLDHFKNTDDYRFLTKNQKYLFRNMVDYLTNEKF